MRLNEDGVIVHKDGEVQLSRQGQTLNEQHRQGDARRWLIQWEMQQTSSRWRAASSASAGTGAAPSAGEAAAPGVGEAASAGAGEAASAGSQSRSRSRSSFSSTAARAIGQGPRSRRHRSRSTPRQFEPASSSWTPRPAVGAAPRAAEAVLMPLTPNANRLLRPKCRARAGASSKIKPHANACARRSARFTGGRVGSRRRRLAQWARLARERGGVEVMGRRCRGESALCWRGRWLCA